MFPRNDCIYETNERRKKNLVKCWSLIFIIAFGKRQKKFLRPFIAPFVIIKERKKKKKKTNNK